MTYKIRAGAPFDLDNLFNRPAIDAGSIVNLYPDAVLSNIDGGDFVQSVTFTVDGGFIPLQGTASYNPTRIYSPEDVIIISTLDNDTLSFDNIFATFDEG